MFRNAGVFLHSRSTDTRILRLHPQRKWCHQMLPEEHNLSIANLRFVNEEADDYPTGVHALRMERTSLTCACCTTGLAVDYTSTEQLTRPASKILDKSERSAENYVPPGPRLVISSRGGRIAVKDAMVLSRLPSEPLSCMVKADKAAALAQPLPSLPSASTLALPSPPQVPPSTGARVAPTVAAPVAASVAAQPPKLMLAQPMFASPNPAAPRPPVAAEPSTPARPLFSSPVTPAVAGLPSVGTPVAASLFTPPRPAPQNPPPPSLAATLPMPTAAAQSESTPASKSSISASASPSAPATPVQAASAASSAQVPKPARTIKLIRSLLNEFQDRVTRAEQEMKTAADFLQKRARPEPESLEKAREELAKSIKELCAADELAVERLEKQRGSLMQIERAHTELLALERVPRAIRTRSMPPFWSHMYQSLSMRLEKMKERLTTLEKFSGQDHDFRRKLNDTMQEHHNKITEIDSRMEELYQQLSSSASVPPDDSAGAFADLLDTEAIAHQQTLRERRRRFAHGLVPRKPATQTITVRGVCAPAQSLSRSVQQASRVDSRALQLSSGMSANHTTTGSPPSSTNRDAAAVTSTTSSAFAADTSILSSTPKAAQDSNQPRVVSTTAEAAPTPGLSVSLFSKTGTSGATHEDSFLGAPVQATPRSGSFGSQTTTSTKPSSLVRSDAVDIPTPTPAPTGSQSNPMVIGGNVQRPVLVAAPPQAADASHTRNAAAATQPQSADTGTAPTLSAPEGASRAAPDLGKSAPASAALPSLMKSTNLPSSGSGTLAGPTAGSIAPSTFAWPGAAASTTTVTGAAASQPASASGAADLSLGSLRFGGSAPSSQKAGTGLGASVPQVTVVERSTSDVQLSSEPPSATSAAAPLISMAAAAPFTVKAPLPPNAFSVPAFGPGFSASTGAAVPAPGTGAAVNPAPTLATSFPTTGSGTAFGTVPGSVGAGKTAAGAFLPAFGADAPKAPATAPPVAGLGGLAAKLSFGAPSTGPGTGASVSEPAPAQASSADTGTTVARSGLARSSSRMLFPSAAAPATAAAPSPSDPPTAKPGVGFSPQVSAAGVAPKPVASASFAPAPATTGWVFGNSTAGNSTVGATAGISSTGAFGASGFGAAPAATVFGAPPVSTIGGTFGAGFGVCLSRVPVFIWLSHIPAHLGRLRSPVWRYYWTGMDFPRSRGGDAESNLWQVCGCSRLPDMFLRGAHADGGESATAPAGGAGFGSFGQNPPGTGFGAPAPPGGGFLRPSEGSPSSVSFNPSSSAYAFFVLIAHA
jgi:uncharacterized coiled-coil protein SlyX